MRQTHSLIAILKLGVAVACFVTAFGVMGTQVASAAPDACGTCGEWSGNQGFMNPNCYWSGGDKSCSNGFCSFEMILCNDGTGSDTGEVCQCGPPLEQ